MFSPLTETTFRLAVLPMAASLMLLEYGLARLAHHDESHDLRETAASLGVALGHVLLRGVESALLAVPFLFLYEHRLFEFSSASPLAMLALFFAADFLYYWQHRASHVIRWMWATHAVHHSPTRINFTAAVRLGWTGAISGQFLFFLPLAWFGFHPAAIVAVLSLNLFYQFFLHTELAPRLGPLEWVLNTPAHHRVHHASNDTCLDRNFGGILIVFDRMFGTFAEAPRNEPLRYGLRGRSPSVNPLRIAFGEWAAILRDLGRAASLRAALSIAFGPVTRRPAGRKPEAGDAEPCRQAPNPLPLGERQTQPAQTDGDTA
jgi:sterol desaturase/sphingolipid hydroxylase (fatty acid hydroxylase superfamily)